MQGLILSCMIHLSVETDFTFSNEKIGDYYTGVRRVLAKIFGNREVLAYVTATEKEHGTKRLFFSTIFPEDLQIFCAWQEKAPLNQTGSDRMKYIPLLLGKHCHCHFLGELIEYSINLCIIISIPPPSRRHK